MIVEIKSYIFVRVNCWTRVYKYKVSRRFVGHTILLFQFIVCVDNNGQIMCFTVYEWNGLHRSDHTASSSYRSSVWWWSMGNGKCLLSVDTFSIGLLGCRAFGWLYWLPDCGKWPLVVGFGYAIIVKWVSRHKTKNRRFSTDYVFAGSWRFESSGRMKWDRCDDFFDTDCGMLLVKWIWCKR